MSIETINIAHQVERHLSATLMRRQPMIEGLADDDLTESIVRAGLRRPEVVEEARARVTRNLYSLTIDQYPGAFTNAIYDVMAEANPKLPLRPVEAAA